MMLFDDRILVMNSNVQIGFAPNNPKGFLNTLLAMPTPKHSL